MYIGRKTSTLAILLALIIGKTDAQAFENPVIKHNCPDPTIIDDREKSGWFYLYSTQTEGKDISEALCGTVNLPIYRSKNLVNWEFVGDGFPGGRPDWVEGSKLWAPDVTISEGKYILYYALGVWGGIFVEACGVAVAEKPEGPFVDKGEVVSFKSMGTLNAIDPDLFVDKDKKYLYWGSLGGGIYGVELSADGMSVAPGAKKTHLSGRNTEGAYLHKRNGWYYLFASRGTCCEGEESTYHLIAGRSRNPLGPFVGPDGQSFKSLHYNNVILERNDDGLFIGPGHNAGIIQDKNGKEWILYHSYWKGNGYDGRCLVLDRVVWDKDGWPQLWAPSPTETHESPEF